MRRIGLTEPQANRLIAEGIDIGLASTFWKNGKLNVRSEYNQLKSSLVTPAPTLHDMIDLLPDFMEGGVGEMYFFTIKRTKDGEWMMGYEREGNFLKVKTGNNLLNMAYDLAKEILKR